MTELLSSTWYSMICWLQRAQCFDILFQILPECKYTLWVIARTHHFACRNLDATGKTKRCLNLGSYNYLGFAAADEYCTPKVLDVLEEYGCSMCSSRIAAGDACLLLECIVAPAFVS